MPDFLLEIGTEEIPARMIAGAQEELQRRVKDLLARERLTATHLSGVDSPRRLAVLASGISAAQAFAKKAGIEVAHLERTATPKGEYLTAKVTKKGRTSAAILAEALPKEIASLYWPKSMYWRKPSERCVRPVRWVVAMLDDEVVPVEFFGIMAGNQSRGHRILADRKVAIPRAGVPYVSALRDAKVLSRADREQQTRKALDAATRAIPGARWREDKNLLDTVVNLTECPSAILGSFEPEYLALPEEVLVTVMRDHQKYFAVESADGKLAPHFLAVLNTEADDEGRAVIRHGNARVLRAPFKAARFFWDVDQKTPLADRVDRLKSVTFQKELGSYHWKTEQNLRVVRELAATVKAARIAFDEPALVKAVDLAKTDLTAELVKEFTELQGIIGGLYAGVQGLGDAAAQAIYDQYTPASVEDAIPTTVEGQLLGIADRIKTITAMFGIGMAPTGSKDPFALRRAANAIVKILAESELPLTLAQIVLYAPGAANALREQIAA